MKIIAYTYPEGKKQKTVECGNKIMNHHLIGIVKDLNLNSNLGNEPVADTATRLKLNLQLHGLARNHESKYDFLFADFYFRVEK